MRNRRTIWLLLAFFSALFFPTAGAIIAEWNFNSTSDDADTATGSSSPSRGEGAFTPTGGATLSFDTVRGSNTSDPATSDDSQVRIRSLPRMDALNKGVGVEFTIVTTGLERLALRWDQYNSRTASRYWRVQYSRDGLAWTDHSGITNTNASAWTPFQVSFADVAPVNNRPYLGIRLVQEFESTATGAGLDAYAAVDPTAAYSTQGSWWLDMVSISGRVIGSTNSPPLVSNCPDQTLFEGSSAEPIPFTISDAESEAVTLQVTATASNPELITGLVVEGAGRDRMLKFRAAKAGEMQITIRVTDEEGDFSEAKFKVAILPEFVPPLPNFFVLWDFNGKPIDTDPATGSLNPAIGIGTFSVIGTTNQTFGSVGQARTSDPAETDNSMLRISSFPRQGENNRTCGVELMASTAGLHNIVLFWDQYNSSTASRYWRIQYTTNGSEFLDFALFTNSLTSSWLRSRNISFAGVPGASNNPAFGIRIVAEFATEAGYAPVSAGSSYGLAGTLWLDMIGLSGERLPEKPEPPPELRIVTGAETRLSWPIATRAYSLEFAHELPGEWSPVEIQAEEQNGPQNGRVEVRINPEGTARFFRLRRDPF